MANNRRQIMDCCPLGTLPPRDPKSRKFRMNEICDEENERCRPSVGEVVDIMFKNGKIIGFMKPTTKYTPNSEFHCSNCCGYVRLKSVLQHINTNRCSNRRYRNLY